MAKEKFKKALESLKEVVCDLTSLEVQTYTGDLKAVVDTSQQLTDFEGILNKVKSSGTLKLVYVTKINFDGDGIVLVPETSPPDHIQEAHNAAVKAGHEVRLGLLTLFSDITGLKTTKP